jgi:hypothetical protein
MGLIHTYYKIKHFYNKLSNRTLWILLLLGIIFSIFLFYWYIFVLSLYTVEVISNVDNYKIKLVDKKFWQEYNYDCVNTLCYLKDLPNLEYKISVLKEWYFPINWVLTPKYNKKISIILDKEVILKPVIKEEKIKELSREEKIKLISKKHKNYLVLNSVWKEFIFSKNNWNLELFYNQKLLARLPFVIPKNEIKITNIIWEDNIYLLSYWKDKYLLNLIFLDIQNIKLNLDILYAKKITWENLLLTTKKWSFLYNLKTKKLNYFNSLFDFVILDNWDYIWILKDDLETQKKTLWFWEQKWDIIVYYDTKTKKARLLKNPWFKISKIYLKNNWVYIENDNWDVFELLNYN